MDSRNEECVKTIKPIDRNTVHKICSGQVVLNLATAVKELVENALDAGATSIEVKLKNFGMDNIEVSDNGCGVVEENFSALTLKYHTSKLSEFSDLLGVTSFGFRGEALSSLCALSDLIITTKHISSHIATKIEYDHTGNIKCIKPCARQTGTTVTLSNLFSTLPVRQKEFHKNYKREFNKMTQLLYAYCLISVGVKIICTNITKTGHKSIVVATQGSKSYRDNLACVFGSKQLQTLLEIIPKYKENIKENIMKGLRNYDCEIVDNNIEIDDVEINLSEDSNDNDSSQTSNKLQSINNKPPFEFHGYISTCCHGSGRSSSDRQFYYVNSRPCEPTKLIKLVNEVYKQYNPNQYPFIFLNLNIERESVDVNVTPDKRQVFLTKEKIILDVVKYSLTKLYEKIPATMKIEKLDRFNEQSEPFNEQPRIFNAFLKQFGSQGPSEMQNDTKTYELKRKSTTMLDYISPKALKRQCDDEKIQLTEDVIKNEVTQEIQINNNDDYKVKQEDITSNEEIIYLEFSDKLPNTQIRQLHEVISEEKHTIICKNKTLRNGPDLIADSPKTNKIYQKSKNIVTDKDIIGKVEKRSVIMNTSLEHVKLLSEHYNYKKESAELNRIKFQGTIDPIYNKKCEEELSKEISKDSFKCMEVLGQFNLGFIVTRLEDDLFIIDQHATDEIYNFETLQKTTELSSQKLVIPQPLELTGVNEQILMDNLEIFKQNGFTFEVDEEAPPTKRVKLLTIPMSKNWIFGKEDIEEMLFMLREDSYEMCRPSRVKAMFASRACRKSVMIGTALTKADMKVLVDHMAEIEKPWNCPHGRPTIRHLVNMAMLQTKR